jgi:drug/metabolite transporter (DMT)-like permease
MFGNFVLLVGISLAWAAGYLFIGSTTNVPPITATAIMAGVAAVVLLVMVRVVMRRDLAGLLRQRGWVPMVMGLTAIGIPNVAVVYAEHRITPDLAALLGVTVPIATLLITTFITREAAFSATRMCGAVVAVVGLYVFLGADDLNDLPALMSMAIMMAGGVVFAFNGVFVARQTSDLDEYALITWTMVFGAMALTVAACVLEAPLSTDYSGTLWALAGEGIVGIALAYVGYYILVARAGANFAAYYAFLVPPLGITMSALAFDRAILLHNVAGVAIVLAGLFLLTRGVAGSPSKVDRAVEAPAS